MEQNIIYTIGRQFGSGGKEIGIKLAEKLGIKCYDRELLELAAKDSGLCQELFENHDEKPTNSFLYSLVMDTYSLGYSSSSYMDIPITHKVFLAQFDSIKKLAEKGPCVIVGRCADFILKDRDDCFNVFIHADEKFKAERIVKVYGETDKSPEKRLRDKDKKRKINYKYYTDQDWGVCDNYDISLNTGTLGIDKCVDIIEELVK